MPSATSGPSITDNAPASTLAFAPAVLGGPEKLSSAARAEIRTLSGHRPRRWLLEAAINWLAITVIIWIGVAASNVFVTLLCISFIGVRQMVFGLLLHDQVHRLGLRGKYGDWIANCLVAYPLFATTVEDYAKIHLSHHKYFMTKKDPDFIRKSGEEWTFPMSIGRMLWMLAMDLTGLNTIKLIKGKTGKPGMDEFKRQNPSPLWLRVGCYALAAGVITWVHGWMIFLIYWVVPVLTVTQLGVRWIAMIEHEYNVEDSQVLEVTPLIKLTWWQRILFPDLNFAMHAYHHLHPGVSFANLPRVHEIYRREGLVDDKAIFNGQGAFVRYLVGRR
jgi:fatty acid desaturase